MKPAGLRVGVSFQSVSYNLIFMVCFPFLLPRFDLLRFALHCVGLLCIRFSLLCNMPIFLQCQAYRETQQKGT